MSRRQPSDQFLSRLNGYRESSPKPIIDTSVKPSSWIQRYKEGDAWLWTEVAAIVIGLAFIIPTAIALWIDLEDRQTQRIAQAWESVTRVAPGNSGKGPALEYLNSQNIPLVGLDLSVETNQGPSYLERLELKGARLMGSNLSGADLRSADLSEANLSDADLSEAYLMSTNLSGTDLSSADLSEAYLMDAANLSRADLWAANLSGAYLSNADLSGVNLRFAELSGAYLRSADLSGADLWGADLSRADLSGVDFWNTNLSGADLLLAKNLDQSNLDGACGDEETKLPEGFTIKYCPVQ